MPRVEDVVLILLPRSLRPVLLYRRSDLFQVAVSLTLAAPEGVLVDLERVAEDALRDRGNERVLFVVECIFGLDDMSGEQHLELLAWARAVNACCRSTVESDGQDASNSASMASTIG